MVEVPKHPRRKATRGSTWAEQLTTVLKAAELAVGPPFGSNLKFARFIRRVVPLIERLAELSEDEFCEALGQAASFKRSAAIASSAEDEELRRLSLEEVERYIADSSLTKQKLLDVARVRFEASTGALTKLPREAILEHISSFVMNERSHQTLERLASAHKSAAQNQDS